MNKYQLAWEKIKSSQNILLIAHERPDGDAIASLGIFIDLCQSLNKNFYAFCQDQVPKNLSFLPFADKIKQEKNFALRDFDLVIIADTGCLSRTGVEEKIQNNNKETFIIEFDHHPEVDDFSHLKIREPEAAATTEIIYNFLKTNHIKINKNIATSILTGILTDTANFLYQSTSEKTVGIASEMLIYGAKFPLIVNNTWKNKSLEAMKLLGQAFNNLTINNKYQIAFSVLTKEDIENYGSEEDIFGEISGFLSNLKNVKAIMFLREEENGFIKGSLRSSQADMDVSKLASRLGGGGHAKASGFFLKGKLEKNNGRWQVV